MIGATIIDTGVGNLGNLKRALDSLGARSEITSEATKIASSRCLFLPGGWADNPSADPGC